MRGTRSRRATASVLIGLFAVVAAAAALRLAGFGVVVTQGSSMAPRLATGDIAVTRAADAYQIGDVVAYHSPTIQARVLHRIVRVEGDRFVTKGDNNSWTDPDHPSRAEIGGRLFVHLPGIGRAAGPSGRPALALTAAALLLGAAVLPLKRAHRRRRTAVRTAPTSRVRSRAGVDVAPWAVLAAIAALGAVVVGAIWLAPNPAPAPTAAAAPAAPATAEAERLAISYSAHTSANATYPDGRVNSGDPIFVKAVRALHVSATYTGRADDAVMITAELAHPGGWHRPIPLHASAATTTTRGATASATVDVTAVTRLLEGFAAETGLPAPGTSLRLTATAGSWTTRGELTFDGVQFQANPEGFTATRAGPASPGAPAAPTTGAAGPGGVLAALGRSLPTWPWRAGATLAVLVLVAAGMLAARRRLGRTSSSLPANRLVAVTAHTPATGRTTVDVLETAALARIADQMDLPIFHTTTADGATYLIDDGAVVYRLQQPGFTQAHALADISAGMSPHLLARIAEELRQPLAAVVGAAEILAENNPHQMTTVQHTMLNAISRGSARLQQLGETLSVLTDLQTGTARRPTELVDLDALIDERCMPLENLLASRQITITRDVDATLPMIEGDADKLSRALDGILGSTLAASTPGSTLTIRTRRADGRLAVTVTASGPNGTGGTTAVLDEPDADRDLGLALARAVAAHHRGQINLAAHNGSGRTATLELPTS